MTEKEKEIYFKMWETEFYDKFASSPELEDEEFRFLGVGFFIAKGCNIKDSFKLYEYCVNKEKF